MRTPRAGAITVCLLITAAACSGDDDGGSAQPRSATTKIATAEGTSSGATAVDGAEAGGDTTGPGSATTAGSPRTATNDPNCPAVSATPATPDGPANTAEVVQSGGDGEPHVEMVVYPRPDHEGNPWSQWGQGLVTSDGRFLSAMGDHLGVDGDAYLFVYDPADRRLTRFADVDQALGHQKGDWGYGKVHAQMVAGACGDVYVATYWGTRTKIAYNDRYIGDQLLRVDPDTLDVEPLGAPLPGHGMPSMAAAPDGLLYIEAVDALSSTGEDQGVFAVVDPRTDPPEVVFQDDNAAHTGFRSILVDAGGRAYVANDKGGLLAYEPTSGRLEASSIPLPGTLRAASPPTPDGTVYGVTQGPNTIFALTSDGKVKTLGDAGGYTASLARTPDGSRLFWVPDAHGVANESGTPVMTLDTATGRIDTLVSLDALAARAFGLHLGGSYDVAVDPTGTRLFVGLNGGQPADKPWGEVVLAVISLDGGAGDPS